MAFLSHASEDQAPFAEPLGRELERLGLRPSLDRWEIRPGDSLVQRLFDEGLSRADVVVLIASARSVAEPWLSGELDDATLRRITNGTRLIPVCLDDVELPAALRHLPCLTAQRSPDSVQLTAQKIAATVRGRDPGPAGESPPAYATHPVSVPGLTTATAFLLSETVRAALDLGRLTPLDWDRVQERAEQGGLTGDALLESVGALARAGHVKVKLTDTRVLGYDLTRSGYATGIGTLIPDIGRAQRSVVAALINDPPTGDRIIHDVAARAGTYPLVVDEFLRALEDRGLVAVSRTVDDHSRLHGVSPTLARLLG